MAYESSVLRSGLYAVPAALPATITSRGRRQALDAVMEPTTARARQALGARRTPVDR